VTGGKVLSKSIGWNISTYEYVHYEFEFDLNNPQVLSEEENVEEETLVVR
jgi:hypothetical protein